MLYRDVTGHERRVTWDLWGAAGSRGEWRGSSVWRRFVGGGGVVIARVDRQTDGRTNGWVDVGRAVLSWHDS